MKGKNKSNQKTEEEIQGTTSSGVQELRGDPLAPEVRKKKREKLGAVKPSVSSLG